MLFHEFGDPEAPTLLLVHGADTVWNRSFAAAIPVLAQTYRVVAVGIDGFDPEEDTEYENAVVEAERMCRYIADQLGGELFAAYGQSLGCHPLFYLALDRRVRVRHVIFDGAAHLNTGVLTPITARLEAPFARLAARGGLRRFASVLGLREHDDEHYARVIHTGATERSYRNTAYSNAAWCRDLATVQPRPGVHAACWFGSLERFTRATRKHLGRVFPGCEQRTFEGLAHAELASLPDRLRAEIRRFTTADSIV